MAKRHLTLGGKYDEKSKHFTKPLRRSDHYNE